MVIFERKPKQLTMRNGSYGAEVIEVCSRKGQFLNEELFCRRP